MTPPYRPMSKVTAIVLAVLVVVGCSDPPEDPAAGQVGKAHSAEYPTGAEEYHGDAFATMRGSWNRELRTGYKVIRALMEDGEPTGVYEDFMTGFVLDDAEVWGRPTGIAVTQDGALLVSDDANGTIFRVVAEGQ